MVETLRFVRKRLPHWLVAEKTYFVTMRLKGSLPISVITEMRREREQMAAANASAEGFLALQRRQFLKLESMLDSPCGGPRWLGIPRVAADVLQSLRWLDEKRNWHIRAAVIMSTHVHLLMRNRGGRSGELLTDLARFKNFSASRANKLIDRKGRFWAAEDFDHWCRSPDKVEAVEAYIRGNPVKAGLVKCADDWPWSIVAPRADCMDE